MTRYFVESTDNEEAKEISPQDKEKRSPDKVEKIGFDSEDKIEFTDETIDLSEVTSSQLRNSRKSEKRKLRKVILLNKI